MHDVVVAGAGCIAMASSRTKPLLISGLWPSSAPSMMPAADGRTLRLCIAVQYGWGCPLAQDLSTHGDDGLAITNVENASASGSSAFREAYLAVAAGEHNKVVLVWASISFMHSLSAFYRRMLRGSNCPGANCQSRVSLNWRSTTCRPMG